MISLKVLSFLLLASAVLSEKKIELQDIEEDNLKSEKETQLQKSEPRSQGSTPVSAPGLLPLEFLKSDFLRFFENPTQAPQHPRYVQQYAVSEQPERSSATPKPQYGPTAQQAMVGYLSNVPMQIYLVPQYYNDPADQASNPQPGVQYSPPVNRVTSYNPQEQGQQHSNYLEVPTYVTPTGKGYVQQYTSPVTYVSFVQPTVAPAQSPVTPVLAYQMPIVQYPTAIAAPPLKNYYQQPQYTDANVVEEVQDNNLDSHKQYPAQTEVTYAKHPTSDYPRYYNSRAPVRDDYRPLANELPPPNPLLLKGAPPHLSHLPKVLPMYRPITKPVYATGGGFISSTFTPRPSDGYGNPYKRRPTSLLDSYIPSGLQVEYLKRGYTRDPLSAYEALSSARQLSQTPVYPRHFERGFLPNQIYHTAAGGITFGHHKRTAKVDKPLQLQ